MSPNRWWSSDSHFGHRNLLTLSPGRPFTTVEEHDAVLIENWNRVVSPGDEVMHLGDFALSVTVMERVVPQLNGAITLVAGNHCACWTATPSASSARRAPRMVVRYLAAGFVDVWGSGQGFTQVAGVDVMVSHLPSDGDHCTVERYPNQRPQPGPLPLICGHVHHLWRTHGRQVNVGVDQWNWAPIHEDQLAAMVAGMPPVQP